MVLKSTWLAAVFAAIRTSKGSLLVHPANLHLPYAPCFGAHATCFSTRGAAFPLAHFPAAAVLPALAFGCDCSGALVEHADPSSTMFHTKPSCYSVGAAAVHRARHCLAIVLRAVSSHRDGIVRACVRCAVSKGAVLEADKLAKDFRGVAVWIGAGQLHCTDDLSSPRRWCNLLAGTRLMRRVWSTTPVRTPWWSSRRPSKASCSDGCRALLLRTLLEQPSTAQLLLLPTHHPVFSSSPNNFGNLPEVCRWSTFALEVHVVPSRTSNIKVRFEATLDLKNTVGEE